MASIDSIRRLREVCEEYDLEGREILDSYTDEELQRTWNGIGPSSFPGWLRALLDYLHPSLEPVAFIHDGEWGRSDGTKESFTASNERFKRNGYKVAKAKYGWWNPTRYLVMNNARRFGNICQLFGWDGWAGLPKGTQA